ncbi:MAG: Nif3-like dinuclear metal center hexameric protein [Clostridia bacterium]|nr:Nif3-like dinuclear metal center hexameric protein [Clostridia bacterium]
MTNAEVFELLDRLYPCETALPFDNPGFLVGDRGATVEKVLVCLDCGLSAVQEAVKRGCTLIVTHHPVIFDALKSVTEESVVFAALQAGVSVISMHTNLDMGENGVNDCLARAIGLHNVEDYRTSDGYLTRTGEVDPVMPQEFAEMLKTALGGRVKYTAPEKPIRKVLLCSGSGGDYIHELPRSGCDALVTADVKHNYFVDAFNNGLALFDAGHFETEDVVVEPLAEMLRNACPELTVETYHPEMLKYC